MANHNSSISLRLCFQFDFCGIVFAIVIIFGKFTSFFLGIKSDSGSSNNEPEVTDTVASTRVKIKRWKMEKVADILFVYGKTENFRQKAVRDFAARRFCPILIYRA